MSSEKQDWKKGDRWLWRNPEERQMMAETRRVTVGSERGKNLSNFLTDGMRDIAGA